MLMTAVVLVCILAPISGIATEPSVNEQLVQAAKKGDLEQVKTLLAQGGDVNAEEDGRPVLMWAMDPKNWIRAWPMLKESAKKAYLRSVNLDLVKFLVNRGADVNARDSGGLTALMFAVQAEDLAIVRFLVDKGADVNRKGSATGYRSDYAIASGRNMWGRCIRQVHTALMLATESSDLEIMEFLIDKGADLNVKDDCGCTALMEAARRGNLEASEFLIRKGADVNASDKKGRTALLYTVSPWIVWVHTSHRRRKNAEIVRLLVDKGADVNASDKKGTTALMEAASLGNLEIVKFLIEKGADVNVKDKIGRKPLSYASANDKTAVVQYLKSLGAK